MGLTPIGRSTDVRGASEGESASRGGDVAATMEARPMTKLRLTRTLRGAAVALVFALVVAAPAAASQPTRTMRALHGGFVYPAGQACAFDVAGEPNPKPPSASAFQSGGFVVETDFSNGLVTYSVRARGAYVNVETGARFETLDSYMERDRYDADAGLIIGGTTGSTTFYFLPGDNGPFGIVGSNGALYHIDGTVSYTIDANTFATYEFSYSGSITDVCAALS
jgi:hypothetical protein